MPEVPGFPLPAAATSEWVAVFGTLIPIVFIVAVAGVVGLSSFLRHRVRIEVQQTVRAAMEHGQALTPELLDRLEATYAGLRELVRDGEGHLHHHVNIYVNSEAIEDLGGLGAPLRDGDEVGIGSHAFQVGIISVAECGLEGVATERECLAACGWVA